MSIQTILLAIVAYLVISPALSFVVRRLFGTTLPKQTAQMSKATVSKVEGLIAANPVFIASKTYCPFCSASKRTLLAIDPNAKVLELDEMEEGDEISDALYKMTGQRTFPNIFIGGQHIGGNSDLQKFSKDELKRKINEAKL